MMLYKYTVIKTQPTGFVSSVEEGEAPVI